MSCKVTVKKQDGKWRVIFPLRECTPDQCTCYWVGVGSFDAAGEVVSAIVRRPGVRAVLATGRTARRLVETSAV